VSILLLGSGPQVDGPINTGVPAFTNLAVDGATPMDQVLRFNTPGVSGNSYKFVMKTTVGTPGVNDTLSALTFSYKDGISQVGDLQNFLPTAHVTVVSGSQNSTTVITGLVDPLVISFHGGSA
jgi:hypothetical protein